MNAVLLRMLPVREPKQLFYLTHANMPPSVGNIADSRYTFGINVYHRLKEDHSAFSDVIAYAPLSENKTAVRFADTPEEIEANEVSGNFFSALGVGMAAGQPFTSADEDQHSQAPSSATDTGPAVSTVIPTLLASRSSSTGCRSP